jgi:hypothetical protein
MPLRQRMLYAGLVGASALALVTFADVAFALGLGYFVSSPYVLLLTFVVAYQLTPALSTRLPLSRKAAGRSR